MPQRASAVWALRGLAPIGVIALSTAMYFDPWSALSHALLAGCVVVGVLHRARGDRHAGHSVRPRFRLWMPMAAVAVFAVLLALLISVGRAYYAFDRAINHQASAALYRNMQGLDSEFAGAQLPGWSASWHSRAEIEYIREKERYHELLSQKYYASALHPWRPALPDPPEPQKPEGFPF
jgi:hypothetical protein